MKRAPTLLCILVIAACKKSPTGPEAGEVTLSISSDSLYPADTIQLIATVKGTDGMVMPNPTVAWSSSSNAIATVSVGLVRGVAAGNATITASSGGKSATFSAKVLAYFHPAVTSTQSLVLAGTPYGVGVSKTGVLYVTQYNSNQVAGGQVTATSQSLGASTPIGSLPQAVALDPAGAFAYVANQGGSNVAVLAAGSASPTQIPLSDAANSVLVSPDGKTLFATTGSGKVYVITTATRAVQTTVQVGAGANGLAYSQVNNRLYVSSINANTITAINAATHGIERTYPVGGSPERIAITRDGTKLYVATAAIGLQEVDVVSGTVVNRTIAGPGAVGLALSPDEQQVWVTNPPAGLITIVERTTGNLVTTVGAGRPRNVTFDRMGKVAIITDENGQVIFVR